MNATPKTKKNPTNTKTAKQQETAATEEIPTGEETAANNPKKREKYPLEEIDTKLLITDETIAVGIDVLREKIECLSEMMLIISLGYYDLRHKYMAGLSSIVGSFCRDLEDLDKKFTRYAYHNGEPTKEEREEAIRKKELAISNYENEF